MSLMAKRKHECEWQIVRLQASLMGASVGDKLSRRA